MTNYITVFVELKSPKGKTVGGQIVVRDGYALATFIDPSLAKQIYEADLKDGKDVKFNKEHNAFIQKYKNKTKDEILKILSKEIERAGGKLTQ